MSLHISDDNPYVSYPYFLQGLFPNQWRNANVITIPKPNKSKFEIENYRSLSIISTLSKLLENNNNKQAFNLCWVCLGLGVRIEKSPGQGTM